MSFIYNITIFFALGELFEENAAMREKLGISPRHSNSAKPPQLSKKQETETRQQETRALMQVLCGSYIRNIYK